MRRGARRTSYVRDGRGRFASTPGGGTPKRPPVKRVSRGTNRLTRDNSGRITSVGGNGATARGGRLRTGAGNLRARQTDRLKGAPQGVLSRGGKARGKVAAAKRPVGWMQSPEARKDRTDPLSVGHRKDQARRLRALPKAAQRAIRFERMNTKATSKEGGIGVNRQRLMRDIAEGRIILMGNVRARKNNLSPGMVQAIAQQMNRSAMRLKAGMATGNRGRMKYSSKAVEASGRGTAARKIRGARVGGVARKGKAAPSKPTAPKRVNAARLGGTIAKPRGMKPGALAAKRQKPAGKQRKPLTKERISAAKGKITAKLTAVLDEIRKVENAKNRDNTPASGGFSPRYLKLIARGQKADKQLESLRRASKRLKQIELNYDPAKYGYGRGTDQRKSLAAEIRNARKQLTTLQREEATAKKAYEADPVVKFGLWGEIGQNRRQSRKTKERNANAAMSRADRYIGARIAIRQQQNAIKQLRDKAKRQTQETNKRQKPRKPKPAAPKRVTAGRLAGTVAKPRGLKPGTISRRKTKAVPARIASRTPEQQRLRDTQAKELRAIRNRKGAPAERGRAQGQLRGLDLRGGPTNKLSLSSPNPPAFFSSKKQASAHAKSHGWLASDVIPADSRLLSGWVVAQSVGNYIHALNKQGKVVRAKSPGFW